MSAKQFVTSPADISEAREAVEAAIQKRVSRIARMELYSVDGSWRRLSNRALTATRRLDPDIARAPISGRRTKPNAGSNTPAAIGSAIAL